MHDEPAACVRRLIWIFIFPSKGVDTATFIHSLRAWKPFSIFELERNNGDSPDYEKARPCVDESSDMVLIHRNHNTLGGRSSKVGVNRPGERQVQINSSKRMRNQ